MDSAVTYNEFELVSLLQNQNQNAFSYLYDKYNGAIYNSILIIVKKVPVAEDLLQQVFVQYWQKVNTYDRDKGRLFTWMLNIAKNASIDFLRSKAHKNELKNQNIENSVYVNDIEDSNKLNIDTIGLGKHIGALKDEFKIVIQQSYLMGYTHEEISNNLNIPIGTIKTRLRNALIALRKTIIEN